MNKKIWEIFEIKKTFDKPCIVLEKGEFDLLTEYLACSMRETPKHINDHVLMKHFYKLDVLNYPNFILLNSNWLNRWMHLYKYLGYALQTFKSGTKLYRFHPNLELWDDKEVKNLLTNLQSQIEEIFIQHHIGLETVRSKMPLHLKRVYEICG